MLQFFRWNFIAHTANQLITWDWVESASGKSFFIKVNKSEKKLVLTLCKRGNRGKVNERQDVVMGERKWKVYISAILLTIRISIYTTQRCCREWNHAIIKIEDRDVFHFYHFYICSMCKFHSSFHFIERHKNVLTMYFPVRTINNCSENESISAKNIWTY